MLNLLERDYYGASLTRWLLALASLFAIWLALSLTRRWLTKWVGKWAATTETEWDDLFVELIRRTKQYFLIAVSLVLAARAVPLSGGARAVLSALLVIATLVQTGVWGNGIILFLADRYIRLKTTGDVASRATVSAVGYVARAGLWLLLALTGLGHFNVDIRGWLAGLGIGGIAVALAAQNVLSDLFAAVAIVLDRPFVVGDSVAFDNIDGDIEEIGLKTTRIRSVNGEQVIVANSELLKTRIRNFGRMQQRRAAFSIEVTYDTPPDTLARIPAMIKETVEKQPNTRFDRCNLLGFGDSALRFDAVYFVLRREYRLYADTQQAINLEILRRFAAEKISFAFPTRTVLLQRDVTT